MLIPRFDNSLDDLSTEKKIFFARTQADWYLDDTAGTHQTGLMTLTGKAYFLKNTFFK